MRRTMREFNGTEPNILNEERGKFVRVTFRLAHDSNGSTVAHHCLTGRNGHACNVPSHPLKATVLGTVDAGRSAAVLVDDGDLLLFEVVEQSHAVGGDEEPCVAVTYKEALDRLNAPESAVIMSTGHNDEARLARWHLRKDEQDWLIERFKDHPDPLAILVVCDMLLTGFDAPAEQVMYLDAPLKEHTLLQAIARVNREHAIAVGHWGTVRSSLAVPPGVLSPQGSRWWQRGGSLAG